ncbi:MAG: DUF4339 domain-containing protein [Planctomycetota bacterium]
METTDYSLAIEERPNSVPDDDPANEVSDSGARTEESSPQSESTTGASNDMATAPAANSSSTDSAGEDAQWYVRPPSGGQFGPASQPVFEQWLSENRVTGDSLVWRNGWTDWLVAEQALQTYFPTSEATHAANSILPSETNHSGGKPTSEAEGLPTTSSASTAADNSTPPSNGAAGNARDISLSERNRLDRRRKKRRNYRITIGVLTLLAIGLLAGLIVALMLQQGE